MDFFSLPSKNLYNIRWNVYALVKEHFSRESVMWMSIPELNDYISIVNSQREKEETEWKTTEESKIEEPKTFSSVFGNIGNPFKK